jgi:glucokinase
MTVRVLAVDVGGTDMKAALTDGDATALAFRSQPTPRTPAGIVDAVAAFVDEFGGAQAIGLAVPGVVDEERGVAVWSENLGWRDVPFVAEISERCGLPVAIGHDVRTGALAETRLGAARGMSDVVYLSIGTGIAAGIVLGGRLHAGGGYAGEIGHTPAGHDEPCACGGRGCLEAIASAAAIARRYTARSGRPVAGAAEVLAAGDPDALAVWDEALDALAGALAWVASVLAPEVVVIGGGLSRAGAALFDPLSDRIPRRLTFQPVPRLVPAALGDRAGCIGAALLALDSVRRAA